MKGNVRIGGLVAGEKDKLGSGGAKANHAFREAREFLKSESREDGGVELDSRRKVGLGDVEENVSDRHFEEWMGVTGTKRCRLLDGVVCC